MSYIHFYELAFLVAAFAIVGGLLLWFLGIFASRMVGEQLKRQKIFFPIAGSKSFSPDKYPEIQKYAGQMVDNGAKAKAYATGYLGRHLESIASGMTYAEVSAASLADPSDEAMRKKMQLLFQGETLIGLLLGCAYAYGTFGKIAKGVGQFCTFAGLILLIWSYTVRH